METNQDSAIGANILDLNRTAMSLLRDKQFNPALKLLQEALKTLDKIESPEKKLKLQGITFNNLGCFYKQSKMPNVALQYLKKAYLIEKDALVDSVNLAATHLNICSIYSELGKHDISLKESLQALELMKNSVDYSPNFVSTLVIAYYNTGVEYEFLKCFGEALEYYKYAWDTAGKYLGPSHGLTCSMKKNFEAAERNLKGKGLGKGCVSHEFVLSKSRSRVSSAKSRPRSGRVEIRNKPLEENKELNLSRFAGSAEPKFSSLGLQNVRFLTGDRIQPMHTLGPRVQSAPRNRIRGGRSSNAIANTTVQLNFQEKPLSPEKKNSKIDPKYIKDLQNRFAQRSKMEKAALKIQKCFRGFNSRKIVKILKHKKELKAKTMKAIEELDQFKAQNESLTMQSPSKKVSASPPKSLKPSEKNMPLLQSLIRGFNCRKFLKKQVKSAILIQKTFRKYQVQKIYNKIKEAILFVQSFYRGYLVRKHYLLTS